MTTTTEDADFERHWKNIASSFLKVGVTYGQMWGVMQAELQKSSSGSPKNVLLKGYRSLICCRVHPVRNLPLFWRMLAVECGAGCWRVCV